MENLKDNLAYEQTFSLHFIYWKLTQNDEEECVVRERERETAHYYKEGKRKYVALSFPGSVFWSFI